MYLSVKGNPRRPIPDPAGSCWCLYKSSPSCQDKGYRFGCEQSEDHSCQWAVQEGGNGGRITGEYYPALSKEGVLYRERDQSH